MKFGPTCQLGQIKWVLMKQTKTNMEMDAKIEYFCLLISSIFRCSLLFHPVLNSRNLLVAPSHKIHVVGAHST